MTPHTRPLRLLVPSTLAALTLVLPLALPAAAAPAYDPDPAWGLDPGFGDQGLSSVEPEDGQIYTVAQAVSAVGDESWFTGSAGLDDPSGTSLLLGKLTASGVLDTSVGGGQGRVTLLPPGTGHVRGTAVVVDGQGRIVVLGRATVTATNAAELLVARFDPDLTLDSSFGDEGVRLVPLGGGVHERDLQLQPDGAIVATGESGLGVNVVRLTSDGDLDPTFGGGDGITSITGSLNPIRGFGLAITSDARIVLAGAAGTSGSFTGYLARLLPTGTLDPSFGSGGQLAVAGEFLYDVVRTPDGSLVAAGPTADRAGRGAVRLIRFSSTGRLAPWPGTGNAQRTLDIGKNKTVQEMSLALQHSGKLVVAGSASAMADPTYGGLLVVRALADGSLATGFGSQGHVIVRFADDGSPAYADAVTVSGHDQILVAGQARLDDRFVAAFARFAKTTAPLAPVTELRQRTSTGTWYSCGTTAAAPCRFAVGRTTSFGGRIWPAPYRGTARLVMQRTTGAAVTEVDTPTTPEGNFAASFTPGAGSYRVRVDVPASDTTTATHGPWRYVTVS